METLSAETAPYVPLQEGAKACGISKTVAFRLSREGKLETFLLGKRRYVYTESLRTLPQRLAKREQGAAA